MNVGIMVRKYCTAIFNRKHSKIFRTKGCVLVLMVEFIVLKMGRTGEMNRYYPVNSSNADIRREVISPIW